MKFTTTRIAALVAMVIASPGAHAMLTSLNTLSIENDAVTSFNASDSSFYVSSDGPMLDSFFTMGGSTTKQVIDSQFAYLHNGAALTLTGAPQSNIATFTWFGMPGGYETVGTGIAILSASGDTATVDMSGWVADWDVQQDIPVGALGSGVGNIVCDAGSGCAVGSRYTLKFTGGVAGDAAVSPTPFYLELHGTVGAVPEASTYGMMLAGLGLVGAIAMRRKNTKA